LRLKVDASQDIYFPNDLRGKERYLDARIGMKIHIAMRSNLKQEEEVTLASLN